MLIGIGLLAYPLISNYFYEHRVESYLTAYQENLDNGPDEVKERILMQAQSYNRLVSEAQMKMTNPFNEKEMTEKEKKINTQYDSVLSMDDTGFMCVIDIPKINVCLPVYHNASEEVLAKGIGHIKGSSVPIGGNSTHTLLSGHTGLNSARLFTDLTLLEKGDCFFINVLGEKLAYEVTDIYIVLPTDISHLVIEKDKDLVTLITCTPYGVNSHRLLVKGERTDYTEEIYEEEQKKEPEETTAWMDSYKNGLIYGILFVLMLYTIFRFISVTGKLRKLNRRKTH